MEKQRASSGSEDRILQISELLLDVLRQAMDATTRQSSLFGLKPPQMMFILGLYEKGRLSMREVSEITDVHPAVATRQLDRLVDKGLVQRTRDGADRRVVYTSLTEHGRRMAEEILAYYKDRIEEALSGVSPAETELLHRLLILMKERLSE